MNHALPLLVPGLLFGFGLAVSGMTDPAKVVSFLDITGDWDPSLMFVMGGAIAAFAPLYMWLQKRGRTFVCGTLPGPPNAGNARPDARLLIGAALFGIGWGLAGFCPGPALAGLAAWRTEALVFVPTMILGMLLAQRVFGSDR